MLCINITYLRLLGHKQLDEITRLDRDTIMRLIVDAGQRCEALLATKVRNVRSGR